MIYRQYCLKKLLTQWKEMTSSAHNTLYNQAFKKQISFMKNIANMNRILDVKSFTISLLTIINVGRKKIKLTNETYANYILRTVLISSTLSYQQTKETVSSYC